MAWRSLLVPAMILAASAAASAQAPDYNLGRKPTDEEIRAWDISVAPDGKGLPAGSGTAVEGAKLYVRKGCVICHGPDGRGGLAPNLAKGKDALGRQKETITDAMEAGKQAYREAVGQPPQASAGSAAN